MAKSFRMFDSTLSPRFNQIRHSRAFSKTPQNESIAKFDIGYENNINLVRSLEDRLDDLEVTKANIEKECISLRNDKDLLQKENSMLRKEKDFYEKMYKNYQSDLTRERKSTADIITAKDSKYKSTLLKLKSQLTIKTPQLPYEDIPQSLETDYNPKSNLLLKKNNTSIRNHNICELLKKKLELMEQNLYRVIQEKRQLQSDISVLTQEVSVKNKQHDDMQKTIKDYTSLMDTKTKMNPSDYSLLLNKCDDDAATMSPISPTGIRTNISNSYALYNNINDLSHTDCDKKYNEILKRLDKTEFVNNELTKKLGVFAMRELELQREVQGLMLTIRANKRASVIESRSSVNIKN